MICPLPFLSFFINSFVLTVFSPRSSVQGGFRFQKILISWNPQRPLTYTLDLTYPSPIIPPQPNQILFFHIIHIFSLVEDLTILVISYIRPPCYISSVGHMFLVCFLFVGLLGRRSNLTGMIVFWQIRMREIGRSAFSLSGAGRDFL